MSKLQYWVDLTDAEAGDADLFGADGTRLRLWDQLTLNGTTFPGICQLDVTTKINYDTYTPKDPASPQLNPTYKNYLAYKGWDPAKIAATLLIFSPDDWFEFQDAFALFVPKVTTTLQQAIQIGHPATDLLGIDFVSIVGVNLPQIVEQTMTLRLSMVQWFPPSPVADNFARGAGGAPDGTTR